MIAWLANHLWQSTLLACAIALAARQLRNAPASTRYTLWLVASLKFLVPFSLLTALGAQLVPVQLSVTTVSVWADSLERVAQPVVPETLPAAVGVGLITLWLLGAAAVAADAGHRLQTVRKALRRSVPVVTQPVAVPAGLAVRYSPTRLEPALVGLFKPVLLLPADIERYLTREQLAAVVAHEVGHWRRRDNLTGALHMLVEALFWFHPLVWWIGGRLVEERERACDEAVVAAGHDRRTYAEAILGVCGLCIASPLKSAAGVGGGADLEGRIRSLIRRRTMSRLSRSKKLLLVAGGCSIVVVPIVAGWLVASSATAQIMDMRPIEKAAPVYPNEAALSGLEGYVILEFTVTETGAVEQPVVIESSDAVFEQPSIDAALKFRYQPRAINGQPVATPYVRNRITYAMESPQEATP